MPIAYLLRRLVLSLPTLLLVAVAVFALIRLIPGDPVQLMLGESADPAHPPMPVGHIRACGCPECVAWLEAHEPGDPS